MTRGLMILAYSLDAYRDVVRFYGARRHRSTFVPTNGSPTDPERMMELVAEHNRAFGVVAPDNDIMVIRAGDCNILHYYWLDHRRYDSRTELMMSLAYPYSEQWNPHAQDAREVTSQLDITPTDYNEVANVLGTSGCSNDTKMWTWNVMGKLRTPRGPIILSPGDWVVEVSRGVFVAMDDSEHREWEMEQLR